MADPYVPNIETPVNVADIFKLLDTLADFDALAKSSVSSIIYDSVKDALAADKTKFEGIAAAAIAADTANRKSPVPTLVVREHADGTQTFYGFDNTTGTPALDPMTPVAAQTIPLVGTTPVEPTPPVTPPVDPNTPSVPVVPSADPNTTDPTTTTP